MTDRYTGAPVLAGLGGHEGSRQAPMRIDHPMPGEKIYPVVGSWSTDVPSTLQARIEEIISWKTPHNPAWYPLPGRTLYLQDEGHNLKIKGSGFYNPDNVSYSGAKRTVTAVPNGSMPMPPLPRLFERDLIHTDPSPIPPHLLESVRSTFAPVGGMTLTAARHDQVMFSRLTQAHMPANTPLASYKYTSLTLQGEPMGVSVSGLPDDALFDTAFNLYLPHDLGARPETLAFLQAYSDRVNFSYENPEHRLEVLAKLAEVSGSLLFDFSAKVGLYRFSGGPDNWNLKDNLDEPLYFSDVDTSRTLESIAPEQRGWEVLRNLNSAIHNWFYYFLPVLTHKENDYTGDSLRQYDFIAGMLKGFFPEKGVVQADEAARRIWNFLEPAVTRAEQEEPIGLRRGEHFLEQYCIRPIFHCMMLTNLVDLIQDSAFQRTFPESNTSPSGLQSYIDMSLHHTSHAQMFPTYSPEQARTRIASQALVYG